MTPLDDFWQFVAYRPGLGATDAEWRSILGDALWSVLRPRLFTGDGVAASCTIPAIGRLTRVVPGIAGYQLVCAVTGVIEAEGVSEDEVRCYRLDLSAIRVATAKALGIEPEPGALRNGPRAFALGEWQPIEGVSLPAYLMFPPTSKLLHAELHRLLLAARDGFILLVPESPRIDRQTRDMIEQKKAAVLPLREIIAWDGLSFCSVPAWQTYCDAYCKEHLADRMVPAPPSYECRKTGDYWTMRFDGELAVIKDAIGLCYIAQLLVQPYRKIFAPELLEGVTGKVGLRKAGSAGAQAGKTEIEDAKQGYIDAMADLEEAERNNDEAAQERAHREIEGFTDYLKSVKGFNGRAREASDDADKIRRAMTQAIGRVIKSLESKDMLPAAAQHLNSAIKTGLFMSYEPEEEVNWVL